MRCLYALVVSLLLTSCNGDQHPTNQQGNVDTGSSTQNESDTSSDASTSQTSTQNSTDNGTQGDLTGNTAPDNSDASTSTAANGAEDVPSSNTAQNNSNTSSNTGNTNNASSSEAQVLNSNSATNLISIRWQHAENQNPLATPPLQYEIWNGDSLLDTVSETTYQIRVSDLSEHYGCLSIRAIRGSAKSDHSSPTCFQIVIN